VSQPRDAPKNKGNGAMTPVSPAGTENTTPGARTDHTYPDLPDRFGKNTCLNSVDISTFYVGEEKVFTDYPAPGAGTQD